MDDQERLYLFYGGMDKLGPGDPAYTQRALDALPTHDFRVVVDAGCGSGQQTLVLAQNLRATVHALDTFEAFLPRVRERAAAAGVGDRVQTHAIDMAKIPEHFPHVDLLWSEGSAYSIGFENALLTWASALAPNGYLVISEVVWRTSNRPEAAKAFWAREYPDMRDRSTARRTCLDARYHILDDFLLPRESWWKGYYDQLKPRCETLTSHADVGVRAIATAMLEEISVFEKHGDSYAYAVFVLQRA